ncbi:MAG TPA: hypothetical protein VJC05_00885 [Candidatus Andersenbacteria bacterium]|nr:hypothetical protein [Candidatus Andersenbacteria bacterium]
MAAQKFAVTGDQYRVVDRRMRDIMRQLDEKGGSPLDPDVLANALQVIIDGGGTSRAQAFLGNRQVFQLPDRPGVFNPHKFFVTRDGLYVSGDFRRLILPAAAPTNGTPACEIASYDLVRNANDREIRSELPEVHVFEVSDLLPPLAGMIERQKGGAAGPLLTNRYANLCYVLVNGAVFAVIVCWIAIDRRWGVSARPLFDSRGDAGSRAFSRTAAA